MADRRRLWMIGAALFAALLVIAMGANAEDLELLEEIPENEISEIPSQAIAVDNEPNEELLQEAPPVPTGEGGQPPPWIGAALTIGAGLGVLWLLTRQKIKGFRRPKGLVKAARPIPPTEPDAEQVAELATDLIGELRIGADPRQAILAAYSNVEQGFGTRELARKPAETPLKYLSRVFGRRRGAGPALERLTELFQVARFSREPVDEDMRTAAIDALEEIRDQYKAGPAIRRRTSVRREEVS